MKAIKPLKIILIKIILTCCLFILTEYPMQAYPRQKAGIGLSTISGAGISYQVEVNQHWALQISGFPYYYGTNPPDDLDIYLNAGVEFQYNFLNDKSHRLYSFVGVSHWYVERRAVRKYEHNDLRRTDKIKEINMFTNVGGGIGYEYIVKNSVALSLNLGVQYQSSKKSHLGILIDRNPHGENYLGVGGGIGLHILL